VERLGASAQRRCGEPERLRGRARDLAQRDLLEDPDPRDFDALTITDAVPSPAYLFTATGSTDAPDPAEADTLIATEATVFNAQGVQRAWRQPMEQATNPASWVYLVRLPGDGDELAATSGMSSRFRTRLQQNWPIEVVAEGKPLTRYQAAVQAASRQVWPA
jgi:hypothetical protein